MTTITHTVQVDSRDRETTATANNYVMYLTEPIKHITDVIIRDIQVPNSIYNVVDGSNTFTIDVLGAGTVTLAPGSYSGLDLASHIFNVTTGQAGLDATWSVSYETGSKKFIFTQTNPFVVTFGSSDLADTMGFDNVTAYNSASYTEDYYVKDVTLQNAFIPSDRIANLVKDKYFYLSIDELSDPRVQTAKRADSSGGFSGNNLSRIFGKVPVNSGPGSDIFFDRNGMFKLQRQYLSPLTSLSRLSIKWLDYQGNLINFNGMTNNSFTLECVCENRIKTL
jgi:hypothetical protein